ASSSRTSAWRARPPPTRRARWSTSSRRTWSAGCASCSGTRARRSRASPSLPARAARDNDSTFIPRLASPGMHMAEQPPAPHTAAPKTNPALEKLERDVLRLLETISEMGKAGEKQTLRAIAEKSGLSKDEVNRYLNPQVNEVYNYDRLMGVRGRNRPLYNH